MRLLEHFRVQPSDHIATPATTGPKRVIGILGELQVVRAETRVDERELLSLWIVHCELPAAAVQRKQFRRWVTRSFFAKGRVLGWTNYGGEPDSPLFIEHRVMHVSLAVPDRFVAP